MQINPRILVNLLVKLNSSKFTSKTDQERTPQDLGGHGGLGKDRRSGTISRPTPQRRRLGSSAYIHPPCSLEHIPPPDGPHIWGSP